MKKLILSIALVAFWACGGKEITPVATRLDYIAGENTKEWQIKDAKIYFPASMNVAINPVQLILNCETDDGWVFYRDGKFEKIENATKCQGITSPKLTTSWLANDTYDTITFNDWALSSAKNKTNVKFTVSNLTDSTMTLTGGVLFDNTEKIVIEYVPVK